MVPMERVEGSSLMEQPLRAFRPVSLLPQPSIVIFLARLEKRLGRKQLPKEHMCCWAQQYAVTDHL